MRADARDEVRLRHRRSLALLTALVACVVNCNGSQPGGGGAGGQSVIGGHGGGAVAGKGGAPAMSGGAGGALATGGFGGGGGAAGAPARGACTQDSDCVFRAAESCCGSCLASGDVVLGRGPECLGVACAPPPGGCSCVDHVCTRGILPQNAPCDTAQDACGTALKCCALCGGVVNSSSDTAALAATCGAPSCLQSVNTNGAWICPQLVD